MLTLWNQFDDLFNDQFFRSRLAQPRSFVPAVDIRETKEGYDLVADVPGLTAENIDVTVEDGVLKLKGERLEESESEKDGYRRVERTFGAFERSFVLPKGVNPESVVANVDHGQLRVHIPKPAEQTPKKIPVRSGASA